MHKLVFLSQSISAHMHNLADGNRDPSSLQSKFIHECAFMRSNHSDVSFIIPAYQPVCGFLFGFFLFFFFFQTNRRAEFFPLEVSGSETHLGDETNTACGSIKPHFALNLVETAFTFLSKNIITVM